MIGRIRRGSSLWHMILAPTIWALHFCVIYGTTAIACARTDLPGDGLRFWLVVESGVALLLVLLTAWFAWRQWDYTDDFDYVHDGHTTESRREFLGHVGFLLSVISAIGVVYVTLPVFTTGTCQ